MREKSFLWSMLAVLLYAQISQPVFAVNPVPTSWDDPAFANAVTSDCPTIGDGQTVSNLSVIDDGGSSCGGFVGSGTLNNTRIDAREGPRITHGQVNLNWVWIAVWANLAAGDHSDGIQCYSPGSTGTVTVKNTTFYVKGGAHTGYWSADDWRGLHVFEDVLFWGNGTGQFGLRIPYDGGSGVSLKNVYFVPGSVGTPFLFDANPATSKSIPILNWENVRWATVDGSGNLVPGAAIPCPVADCGTTTEIQAGYPSVSPELILRQYHSNPFDAETEVILSLSQATVANIMIYDVHGEIVRTLLNSRHLAAGFHRPAFNAKRDEKGHFLANGMYFIRLETPDAKAVVRKIAVIR